MCCPLLTCSKNNVNSHSIRKSGDRTAILAVTSLSYANQWNFYGRKDKKRQHKHRVFENHRRERQLSMAEYTSQHMNWRWCERNSNPELSNHSFMLKLSKYVYACARCTLHIVYSYKQLEIYTSSKHEFESKTDCVLGRQWTDHAKYSKSHCVQLFFFQQKTHFI